MSAPGIADSFTLVFFGMRGLSCRNFPKPLPLESDIVIIYGVCGMPSLAVRFNHYVVVGSSLYRIRCYIHIHNWDTDHSLAALCRLQIICAPVCSSSVITWCIEYIYCLWFGTLLQDIPFNC